MVDRTQAPPLQEIEALHIPQPEVNVLSNGINVYRLHIGEQNVVQMQLIFRAGRWFEPQRLVANLTAKMLREGTSHHTSAEIANKIDYYGADLDTSSGFDRATVKLTCLSKYFDDMAGLIYELVTEAAFPEKELHNIALNQQQKLQLNLEKNDYLARKTLQKVLYGDRHPYGYAPQPQEFGDINKNELLAFFQHHYTADNCFIILAGDAPESAVETLDEKLGHKSWQAASHWQVPQKKANPSSELKQHHEGPQHLQSAICMGMPLFNKTHEDYHKMTVLNTVLGGYFGSRLMANLRERNGYTYGVHSSLVSYEGGGHLQIETEVGADIKENAIGEIYKEIQRLQDQKLDNQEMTMVRNYLQGMMLYRLDGPFRLAQTLKNLYTYKLDINYLYNLIDEIQTITPEELQKLANQYLVKDHFYEIAIG